MLVFSEDPPEGHSKQPTSENQKSLTLACDTYQDAENWVTTIESQILELSGHLKDRDGDRNRYRSAKHIPRPEVRLAMVEKWVTTAKWKLFATHEGYFFYFNSYDNQSINQSTHTVSNMQGFEFCSPRTTSTTTSASTRASSSPTVNTNHGHIIRTE